MAQLDVLIIFPLLIGFIITLFVHYKFLLDVNIPFFFGTAKFRIKKISYLK